MLRVPSEPSVVLDAVGTQAASIPSSCSVECASCDDSVSLAVLHPLAALTQSMTTSVDVSGLAEYTDKCSSVSRDRNNDVLTSPSLTTTAEAKLELRPLPWPSFECSQVGTQLWYTPVREKISRFMRKLMGITYGNDTSTATSNSAMVPYMHCKRPLDPDDSECLASRYFMMDLVIDGDDRSCLAGHSIQRDCELMQWFTWLFSCPVLGNCLGVFAIGPDIRTFMWLQFVIRCNLNSQAELLPNIMIELKPWPSWKLSPCISAVTSCLRVVHHILASSVLIFVGLSTSTSMHAGESYLLRGLNSRCDQSVDVAACFDSQLFELEIPWYKFSARFRSVDAYIILVDMKHWNNKDMSSWNYPLPSDDHAQLNSYSSDCTVHYLGGIIDIRSPCQGVWVFHEEVISWASVYVGEDWKCHTFEWEFSIHIWQSHKWVLMSLQFGGLQGALFGDCITVSRFRCAESSELTQGHVTDEVGLVGALFRANEALDQWCVSNYDRNFYEAYPLSAHLPSKSLQFPWDPGDCSASIGHEDNPRSEDDVCYCPDIDTSQAPWAPGDTLVNYHVQIHCSMKFGCGKLLWDPGIWAFLCSYEFLAPAVVEGGMIVEALTYCYSHYTTAFDQAPVSHDYYTNIIQVHPDQVYDISPLYQHDPVHHSSQALQFPWDPGGSSRDRLEGKPNLKEGGLSATSLLGYRSWAVACSGVTQGWYGESYIYQEGTYRRGGLGTERKGGFGRGLARRV